MWGRGVVHTETGATDFASLVHKYRMACEELDAVLLTQMELVRAKIKSGWYLIRKNPRGVQDIPEVRIAVVGNVDAGKSTMLGVLTGGQLDDGRGRARVGLFRHKHEVESGRTSSIGQEILAFDEAGNVLGPRPCPPTAVAGARRASWDELCVEAHKVITFMDLAGHERYLKTTMFGLTGGAPDYAMLMVGANAGLVGMAKEHLALAFALSTPVLVVITKIDMSPEGILESTVRQLQRILRAPSTRRTPMLIKGREDVLVAVQNFVAQRLCPIFQVSNVEGTGIDLLKMFLHLLPQGSKYGPFEAPAEFQITDTYSVPGVGTVVAGTMVAGSVAMGQTLYLGPDSGGAFVPCQVKGVQRKRVNVHQVFAGQCASLALKRVKRAAIRKGMVLVGRELAVQPPAEAKACWEFEAEVVVLFHSTTISHRYQAMLHCGVVRQTVAIVGMREDVLRTGDRSIVRFRFVRFPEYLKVGSRLLFREGRTKGVGRVTALFS